MVTRFRKIRPSPRPQCSRPTTQNQIQGIRILTYRGVARRGIDHREAEARRYIRYYRLLQCKEVVNGTVEPVRPHMPTSLGVDQLSIYPHLATETAHAAFKHVAHAE